MEIKTKANVGEKVFVITNNEVHLVKIKLINVTITDDSKISINYDIGQNPANKHLPNVFDESRIFLTKQNLLNSL